MARVFLVDANVWSEAVKPAPSEFVMQWMAKHQNQLVMSAIVLGEIQAGVSQLDEGKKKKKLQEWLEEVADLVPCLAWDKATALLWGELVGRAKKKGSVLPLKDSMIAASALRHGLKVATRNAKDFVRVPGLQVVDPFVP